MSDHLKPGMSWAELKKSELEKGDVVAGPKSWGRKEAPGTTLSSAPTDGGIKQKQEASPSKLPPGVLEDTHEVRLNHAQQVHQGMFDYKGDLGSRLRGGTKHWKAKDHRKIAEGLKARAVSAGRGEELMQREIAEAHEHEFIAAEKEAAKPKKPKTIKKSEAEIEELLKQEDLSEEPKTQMAHEKRAKYHQIRSEQFRGRKVNFPEHSPQWTQHNLEEKKHAVKYLHHQAIALKDK